MAIIQLNGSAAKPAFVFWGGGTYSASSQATDFPAINAGTQDTYSEWKAASAGSIWLQVDKGSMQLIDSVGVANHTIATSGIGSVALQYSVNGSSWINIGSVATLTDQDFIAFFPVVSARYIRISWNGPAATIGVFQATKRLEFKTPAVLGYTPIQHSMQYDKEFNNSITGHFLTNRVIAKGAFTETNLLMQDPDFVEIAMRPFEDHYNKGGCFFYGGAPLHMPEDMGYCQAGSNEDTVTVEYIEAGKYANVTFSLNVFVGA